MRVDVPPWSLREPARHTVFKFLEANRTMAFSYPEVGQSNAGAAAGYVLDHNRVQIGQGERAFAAACDAVRTWRMFPDPWTKITAPETGIRVGMVVAMQAHALGLWWLNACRVVYLVDEVSPIRRWGFAYGTLPAHVEQGEERFAVELHPDGAVWYDLRAFSRPRYWPVRAMRPVARRLQMRFVRESQEAMRRAVRNARV